MKRKKYRMSKFNAIMTALNIIFALTNIKNAYFDSAENIQTKRSYADNQAVYYEEYVKPEPVIESVEDPFLACDTSSVPYFIQYDGESQYLTEMSVRSLSVYVGNLYNVSPILLQAISWNESRYLTTATNNCGAVGLCQIIPKWHQERIEKLGVTDLKDPYQNMIVCADYIKDIENSNNGNNEDYIIMAYESG